MPYKLRTVEDARRAAHAALTAHNLPLSPVQVDEKPEFYGIRTPYCHMIFARCNARMVYCRLRGRRARGTSYPFA